MIDITIVITTNSKTSIVDHQCIVNELLNLTMTTKAPKKFLLYFLVVFWVAFYLLSRFEKRFNT
jgi:hypothetical protein